jgi:D-alanyl-D-alanine carboxypeptidase/D-alanyl-D-alanine-endopeptidase (penicillin-binding protein 4)
LGESHNWTAEQIVRTLGVEQESEGSWEAGLGATATYMVNEIGVSPLDMDLRDGSGLTANGLLTARAVVRILDHASRQPWGALFREALAAPGVEESTLGTRLEDLEGRVFAKTGSLRHVNALSGYLVTDGGRELLFAILSNGSNLPAIEVRDRIDAFVRELATLR